MPFHAALLLAAGALSLPSLVPLLRRQSCGPVEMTVAATVWLAALGVGLSQGLLLPSLAAVALGMGAVQVVQDGRQRRLLLGLSVVALMFYVRAVSPGADAAVAVALHGVR